MANRLPPASSQTSGMMPSSSPGQSAFGGVPAGGPMLGNLPYIMMPPQQHYQAAMVPPQAAATVPMMISTQLQGLYHLPGQAVFTAHPALPRSAMPTAEERQRIQEKLVKERNYHIQQQRLRDFHAGGNQKVHADRMIQNMLGKLEEPKRRVEPLGVAGTQHILDAKPTAGGFKVQKSASLSGLQPSQKARDWSNLGDLHNVFSAPIMAPGLPQWCQEGSPVPALYGQVEKYVTRNGMIDTSLLYPVLLSSGLSRETLGQIWSLANRQTPGTLTRSELYSVLALVALAQNACQITSLDILHTAHQAPIPLLNQVVTQLPVSPVAAPLLSGPQPTQQMEDDDFDDFKCATDIPAPSVPPTAVANSIGRRLANHHSSISPDLTTLPVARADHQEASIRSSEQTRFYPGPSLHRPPRTSTSVSEILAVPPNLESQSRDGAGFTKQLPSGISAAIPSTSSIPSDIPAASTDLMSTNDDKYSVFRELMAGLNEEKPLSSALPQVEDDDYGDFLSGSIDSSVIPATNCSQVFVSSASGAVPSTDRFGTLNSNSGQQVPPNSSEPTYEFSEFQSAAAAPTSSWTHDGIRAMPTVVVPTAPSTDSRQLDAAFSNVMAQLSGFHLGLHSNGDDFGDFAAPGQSVGGSNGNVVKPELDNISLTNNYFKLKDSGSIESQSVSSLDLGSYDVQSGNSNGLERHGSVPSLDLKVSGGSEEESGDSPVLDGTGAAVSPVAPSRASRDGQPPSMPAPPFDRYSLMRTEKQINTDIHSYEWQRCLNSCHALISDTFKIFNGISNSNVSKEVITSEEGENYLKNIIAIYRIVRRISISAQRCKNLHPKLTSTIGDIETQWNNLLSFVMGSSVFPNEECFEFSSCVLEQNIGNLKRACGVCLLDVDGSSADFKLTYGGRQYHAACANFWVNFVDSLLPSLAFKLT